MTERRVQRAALAGQVVEDLTFRPPVPGTFVAALEPAVAAPVYKDGGLFVFSDVPAGDHVLRLDGGRFQARTLPVTLPAPSLVVAPPGDDELVVVVRSLNGGQGRITFDAVALPRRIAAGAPVLAEGLETSLATALEPGAVMSARLASVAGLAEGAVVRIVRERSVRLKLGPYTTVPESYTRMVGRVTVSGFPETPVEDATVRLTGAGDAEVTVTPVAGAPIATIPGDGGAPRVLGAEIDVVTRTNGAGDFNLYFPPGFPDSATLEVRRTGFTVRAVDAAPAPGGRTRIDVQLEPE